MKRDAALNAGRLDHTFSATLIQSPAKGGWTYVAWTAGERDIRPKVGRSPGHLHHAPEAEP